MARITNEKYAYGALVGRTKGKRPLERPRLRRKHHNKKGLKYIVWDDVYYIIWYRISKSSGLL